MKKFFKIILLCMVAVRAAGAEVNAPGEFVISYWCGPTVGGDVDAKYAEVAECNFNYASFPCGKASVEENKKILDACARHGLKFILSDKRFSGKAKKGGSFTNNVDAGLADYAKHPALGGYFITDEPGVGGFPGTAAVNQYLIEKDPAHFPFINLMPNWATDAQLGGTNYYAYIENFCEQVKPRLLCYDHYALFEGNERPTYFENMEITRAAGLRHNIPMGFIFLVTPHGTYRNPNETDLRWQVNTALAYGCKALFYFTYFTLTDPEANFHNGIIAPDGKRTEHYEMAKRINGELKVLGKTLVRLTSTGVYHTGKTPIGCAALPADAEIQVADGASLVVGFLTHEDGSKWAVVVNRDLHNAVSTTLKFDEKIKRVKELSAKNGKLSSVKVRQHAAALELPAAGIKILKLN